MRPFTPPNPPFARGEAARGGDRRAEEGAIASPEEWVDPSELVSEGFAQPGLGGERDEKPREFDDRSQFF